MSRIKHHVNGQTHEVRFNRHMRFKTTEHHQYILKSQYSSHVQNGIYNKEMI